MSTFAVTVEEIGGIREHTNADRLEMATLKGKDYDFVVLKDQFKPGDVVVYFPVDSLLPVWITDLIGLTGKLSGPEHNRVKTMKLRGNISQGVVASRETFAEARPAILGAEPGTDVTELLEVVKYEPAVIPSRHGALVALPAYVEKYDIEGAQNFVDLVDVLLDEPVFITEKLEGSHWSVTLMPFTDEVIVAQRNHAIEPIGSGEHDWHKVAREGDYAANLWAIARDWEQANGELTSAVTLRGEIVGPGVQGNYYKLPRVTAYIFELEINGTPVSAADFLAAVDTHDLQVVPVLGVNVTLREWLNGSTLKAASDGRSQIADKRREGIVIKPMTEARHESLGRIVLKQRSPEYLSKSEY